MKTKETEAYKLGLIAECQRLNAAFLKLDEGDYMTIKYYDKYAITLYKKYQYQKKLGITFNGLKSLAGIPVDRKRTRKPQIKKQVIIKNKDEFRVCNMCETKFPKFENMHSCPSCTNLKNNSSGFATGFDEFLLGYIGDTSR
jgi:hypothetical protein